MDETNGDGDEVEEQEGNRERVDEGEETRGERKTLKKGKKQRKPPFI